MNLLDQVDQADQQNQQQEQREQHSEFIQHLALLRKNLIIYLSGFVIVFILAVIYSEPLFRWIATPLLHLLPPTHHLTATQVTATVTVPIKLAFWVSLAVTMPMLFWQIWRFIFPALHQKEKYMLLPPLLLSLILFYTGISFAYFLVIPLLLHFFVSVIPQEVVMMADMNYYLSFIIRLAVICGLMFEIPVFIAGLIISEQLSIQQISSKRAYIILACFVIAMLLTPPDAISQFLLALPMWLLFELGLLLGYVFRYSRSSQKLS